MKILICSLLALAASPAWAGYQYYISDPLTSVNPLSWTSSGQLSPGSAGLAATDTNGGSLISRIPIPGGGSEAEVAIKINLTASGGTYTTFLQASPDARTGTASSGSYLAFEMQNPQFDADGKNCSANFLVLQSIAGKASLLAAFAHSCRDGMRMRMAVHGGTLLIWPDQPDAMEFFISSQGGGQPGVGAYGAPAGNAISLVQLGAIDTTPPAAVDMGNLGASVFRTRVELKWTAAADDDSGIGLAGYWVYRDGLYLGRTSKTFFTDETVAAGETHTYAVRALDGHFNFAPATTITLTMPKEQLTTISVQYPPTQATASTGTAMPAKPEPGAISTNNLRRAEPHVTVGTPQADSGGGLDPRRVGVRALGSYWGGGGENIDSISGNMNLTLPLLNPVNRNGGKVTLSLSYNSQIWRQDSSGVTLMGQDTGFGLGWKFQAGSITPVYNISSMIDHYLFTDSTGAEYNLNVNTSNVWTSQEGVYISFDANTDCLFFPDGTFWWMGSVSSSGEPDAGTRYPANVSDTNGNYLSIVYAPGSGSGSYYTSSRMLYIWDPRSSTGPTYIFSYNSDPIPHLISEQAMITPAESYTFTYGVTGIADPFTNAFAGYVTVLQAATSWLGPGSTFSYDLYDGELIRYTTPLGGSLYWQYRSCTYSTTNISLREVQYRWMQATPADSLHGYTIFHDDFYSPSPAVHVWTALWDGDAKAWKFWAFDAAGISYALENAYWELHPLHGIGTISDWTTLLYRSSTWSTANGNLYSSASTTLTCDLLDTSCAAWNSTQVVDAYGNLTEKHVFDYYGNPLRDYYMTYLTGASYTSRYIRNRLVSATVSASSGPAVTLVSNTYDTYSTSCGGSSGMVSRTGLFAHDDVNYSTSNIYRGNVTSTSSLGSSAEMQYESTGVTVCGQNGIGTVVTSTPSPTTSYSLPAVTTPNGNASLSTTLSYDSMWQVTSVLGTNGATSTTTYDSWGRPSQSTIPDGAVTHYTYSYYPSANQQTAILDLGAGAAIWKRTTLDGFGRITKVEKGSGSPSTTPVSVVDTQYAPCGCSPLGKMYRTSMPYAGGGSPSAWTTYTYDERGRANFVTSPDGSFTEYDYGAFQTLIWDATRRWKNQTTDPLGNLVNVLEPDTPNGYNNSTSYTYNGLNQLTGVSMTTASGTQTRSFTYSGKDMVSTTNPENGTVAYTYDGAHHVLTKTDAIGQQTHYSYDSYGRLAAQYFYPLVSGVPTLDPNQTVLYYYDTNPHEPTFTTHAQGRLAAVAMRNSSWWYEYNYSVPGRVQAQRLQVAGYDYDADYAWDQEGRITSLTWPAGPTNSYQYDNMGRVSTMLDSSSLPVATASYGVANEVLGLTYFTLSETRTYNSQFQLIEQNVPGAMHMQYVFTSGSNNGLISSTTDWIPSISSETVNYSYDSLNRLSNAAATSAAWHQSYAYDGFGNLTDKSMAGPYSTYHTSFDPATNREWGVSYDANGNQTSSGTYDVSNRLVTNAIGEMYAYDYHGKRIVKWTGGAAELYVYGIDGQKLTTLTCDIYLNCGSPTYNVSFAGKLVQSKGNVVVTDRLGTVRWNSAGGGIASSYFPYGEERTFTSNNREKFGTYMRDGSGQDYADQRYYGVGTGRFWTVDPGGMATADASNPVSLNRYAYVNGNPMNFYDPRGIVAQNPPVSSNGDTGTIGGSCVLDNVTVDCSTLCDPSGGTMGFFQGPDPGCPSEGGGGGDPAPTPDCLSGYANFMVSFITSYYGDSLALGSKAGIPQDWILAWSADESAYGTSSIATQSRNYFGWHGSGNDKCPKGANPKTGCFSGPDPFLASGDTALFSTRNWFHYNGQWHVSAASILADQYGYGATAAGAFSALQVAGYNGNVNYGTQVQSQYFMGNIDGIEDCLRSQGKIK